MSFALHQHTPSLAVIDPRGLAVRGVAYYRVDIGADITALIDRQVFGVHGRLIEQWDARLFASSPRARPNLRTDYGLAGQGLRSASVDAGWRVIFGDAAGLLLDCWDGRFSHLQREYDECLRPMASFERAVADKKRRCAERLTYGGVDAADGKRNRRGQMVRCDDPAGSQTYELFGVLGSPLRQTRRFAQTLAAPDWPHSETECDELLEDRMFTTQSQHDALGVAFENTDAVGHVHSVEMDVAGQLSAAYVDQIPLLKSVRYNAFGQIELEQAGNDVFTSARYSTVDSQLHWLENHKPSGQLLQKMRYQYDPIGNVERIEDLAQPVQWDASQYVENASSYTYDTLYRLASATGRENASQTIGPALPGLETFGKGDDSRWRNYTQFYTYDSGGNLTDLKHRVNGSVVVHRRMAVATSSNRSLLKENEDSVVDFVTGFDANGNQQALGLGQAMLWDVRNRLQQVAQVVREESSGQDDDVEIYVYDGSGQRVRKVRRAKTRGGETVSEVRYLPSLEIHSKTTGEHLHVIVAQAGRNSVRLLHWEAKKPDGIDNDQLRYSLSDPLRSSTLELDQNAELISQECYYPYGGTAWWAAKNAVDAKYKTVRYSGKERDATGLYYYGARYYAPWLQRWLNPDPLGDIDGLNLFCMVKNDPINHIDSMGHNSEAAQKRWQSIKSKLRTPANQVPGARYIFENILDRAYQVRGSRRYKGVQYWDDAQRESNAHDIKNGKLVTANGEVVNTTLPGEWTGSDRWHEHNLGYVLAYNQNREKSLYIFLPEVNKQHHSSPMAGERVIDAGMMSISHGGIAYIENKSGHYRPFMEQKLHTLKFLKDKGMNLEDTFISDRAPSDALRENFYSKNLFHALDYLEALTDLKFMEVEAASSLPRINSLQWKPMPLLGVNDIPELVTLRNWEKSGAGGRPIRDENFPRKYSSSANSQIFAKNPRGSSHRNIAGTILRH